MRLCPLRHGRNKSGHDDNSIVMPALVAGIHVLKLARLKDVDGRDISVRSTPSFGRLCPAMSALSLSSMDHALKTKARASARATIKSNSALRSAEAPLSAAAAMSTTTTTTGTTATTRSRARCDAGLHRQEALALHLLARKLAGPADGFS
jgi:hypothetical protein